jgi:hypothetical protein
MVRNVAEVFQLRIQSQLRHLCRDDFQRIRFTCGQTTTILLDLERTHVPDHSLKVTQHRAHPIRRHHKIRQLELA